jgi:dipeptide/tripeptide permease
MSRLLFALSLGFAAVILAAEAARAAPQCALRMQVLDTLAQKYGETRRSLGVAADQTVMELFASAETGSWTLTVTLPSGMTCLVAAGQNYESVAEELPARGNPA